MLSYNTQLKKLFLPEYGRNVQKMVDHCMTISDREERNACARTIVKTMASLTPDLKDVEDYESKLWDHLAIMSNFELDVDYPCEIIAKENINEAPERISYSRPQMRYRHYGRCLEQMIEKVRLMEGGQEKDYLISLLANHMKKLQLAINAEGVDDEKIFSDFAEYTHGDILMSADSYRLHDFKIVQPATGKKKKKK
ncbi:MAG: DUF4290 domain-containing protein [Muribaculaceae bacterium]|nr:DUF4290 domain-containing protein [Muribaculaceae bacterium]